MGTEQASLSSRIGGTAKIIVSLSDELKHVLTILAVTASFTEVYNLIWKGIPHEAENALIWTAVAYASLFSVLRYAFGRVTGETGSALAVSVSALLFAFLFRGRELAGAAEGTGEAITACLTVGMIAIPVYLLWLMLKLWKDNTFKYLAICIITDTTMICSYFMGEINELPDITGKAVFASLFVLSAALILSITGYFMSDNVSGSPKSSFMDGRPYPFTYFIIIFACLIIIPVRKGPINWNPVIEAGRSIVYKTKRMAESASYYFSSMHESSGYQTGYSSFDQTGASIRPNDRIEVELKTKDSTTFKYRDETDGRDLVRRKVIYLKGGKGTEKGALLDKLFSLYAGGVDSEEASLFASKSSVDISYIYLRTEDEILPLCPLKLTDKDGHPLETEDKMHGKGYNIHADYLDLDYGSPYLERLIASPVTSVNRSDVSYDEIASYAYKAMGIRLKEAVGEDEFISWQAGRTTPGKEYLDTSGASDRMKKLAEQITADCTGDYEKCKAVEAYLRQYAYSMDTAENGYNTGSAEGMSRLAEDFLFENGKGYCVHFASSMVMLLRLNGIPAEFARGYRYIFPFDRQEVYDIKGSDAHAWPEAYVQGFGWISFEPTSIMSNASDRTWHRQPAAEEADKYYTAYKYNGEIPVPAAALASQVNPYDRPDENVDEAARINRNRGILLETARIAFITIFTVIIMIALIIGGSRLYKIISYRRTDDNGRMKRDVEDIIGYIRSVSGCAFEDRGVISDYEAFIPEKYKPEVTEAFGIYYRIKYRCTGEEDNGEKVTVQEGTKVRELRKTLLQRKKRQGG